MGRKLKEGVKLLRTEKKIIKYKDANGNWIEQEVKVKIYETKKVTEDDSLASEILGSSQFETKDDVDE